MSVRSGHKTSRIAMDLYKGYRVIKVIDIDYHRSIFNPQYFDKDWIERKEVHFDFCKEGNEKRPSQDYNAWAKTIAECKECIDKFLKDDSLYFTAEEREQYVYKPNRKNHWGFGYNSLMKLMREHQKATKRIKILLEDRLTDANFHSECGYLSNGDYEGFEKCAAELSPFNEKFEVYTHTLRKRIKEPKKLIEGLNKVIDDYLASQGIKDTSVEVKFCEEW